MDTRFRMMMITFVGLIAALVWALPYWWAFVNPESVIAEGLPGLTMDERAAYAALPNNIKTAYEAIYDGDDDTEIEPQPEWALALVRARFNQEDLLAAEGNTPFEQPSGSQIIVTGQFASIDSVRQASGNLTIYQNPDGTRLLHIEENFRISRAPEMHLILTRNPDPMAESTGVGVDYIDIGVLRGNVGQQNYTIPPSVDFNRYPVLAIYSSQYDAVLGTATLQ
jgi:hypothetical protein